MGKDKLYHLLVGFIIAFAISFWNPGFGIALAILAGVGKELYDKYVKKSFADPLDTIATTLGGIVGLIFALLFINLLLS